MFKDEVIAIAGSRSLSSANAKLVKQVVVSLVRARCNLVVGCATGADEAALSVLSPVGRQGVRGLRSGRAGCLPVVGSVVCFPFRRAGRVCVLVGRWRPQGSASCAPVGAHPGGGVVGVRVGGVLRFAGFARHGARLSCCRLAWFACGGVSARLCRCCLAVAGCRPLGSGQGRGLWSGAWAWEADQASFL